MKSRLIRWLAGAAFFIYMIMLFDLVFFSADFGRVNAEVLRYQTVNLIPFRTIRNYFAVRDVMDPSVFLTNVVGNVVAFMPLGFLFPVLYRKGRTLLWLFCVSLCLSLFIELTQGYLGVGVMDVDDLILNVLGGVIGYLIFKVARAFMIAMGYEHS